MASKFSDLAFCFKNWIAMTSQTGGIWGLLVAVSQNKIADDPFPPTNLARQCFTAAFAWDLDRSESKGIYLGMPQNLPKPPTQNSNPRDPHGQLFSEMEDSLIILVHAVGIEAKVTHTKYHSFDLY